MIMHSNDDYLTDLDIQSLLSLLIGKKCSKILKLLYNLQYLSNHDQYHQYSSNMGARWATEGRAKEVSGQGG